MHIINTNILTSNQYHDCKSLIEECKLEDNSRGISFLEPEMNFIKEFPCFFLLYDDGILISVLSIFIPEQTQCEIYANTHPKYRKKGYFSKLLGLAKEKIKEFDIKTIYIVNEPCSIIGTLTLNDLGATLTDTDYLMRYNTDITPIPTRTLTLQCEMEENTEIISSYLKDTIVGHCYVEHSRSTSVIFGFFIEEEYRKQGYGSETLLLVLEKLLADGCRKILLHVNEANEVAYNMYYNHGFIHDEQVDYWEI